MDLKKMYKEIVSGKAENDPENVNGRLFCVSSVFSLVYLIFVIITAVSALVSSFRGLNLP